MPTVTRTCLHCGKPFSVYIAPSWPPNRGLYCGRQCNAYHTNDHRAYQRSDPVDRFWRWIEKSPDPDGCWLWTGHVVNGYGRMTINRKGHSAHRFAYETYVGPIPEGMFVCHRCDTPRCCRPDHLFVDFQAGNMADMIAKGRRGTPKAIGTRAPTAKLTEADVIEIRRLLHQRFSAYAIAQHFGVGSDAIYNIRNGKNWTHVPDPDSELGQDH